MRIMRMPDGSESTPIFLFYGGTKELLKNGVISV